MQKSSNYGTIPGMIILFCAGFSFDIIGRKFTIAVAFMFGGFAIFLYVLASPSHTGYIFADILLSMSFSPLADSPLVMDYAMKESTAKLLAWRLKGVCVGSLLSTDALLTLTVNWDPLWSFGLMAMIFVGFGLLSFVIIREPPHASKVEKKKLGAKVIDILKNIWMTMKKMPYLCVAWNLLIFVQGPMVILELYLYAWL